MELKHGIKSANEIKAFDKIELEAPKNIKFKNSILTFDKVENAKFYIIYRSKNEIKFTTEEIIDMLGNPENNDRLEWKENDSGNYKYGLRVISYTNSLGNTTIDIDYNPDYSDTSFSKINSIPLIGLCILLFY